MVPATPTAKAKPALLDLALPIIVGVLVVAMVIACGFLIKKKADLSHQADVRGCFLAAAETSVNDIVNVSAANIDEKIGSILDGSTGAYRDQFEGASEQFASMAREVDATSEGSIVTSAVEDNTDTSGTVLVVAMSTVTNTNTPEPKVAYFRMRVTVDKVDGQCKTSNVEYVI
ncbi:hypothetical protein [Tomitella biformata]|uniref:hypothetical protein n=1 Tax=Tomitella biformata TaxID=630403 RepID=UPI0004659F7E|nr:hypothetical protein [Tomitella biformata]